MILEKLLRKGGRRRLSNENSDISNPAENSKHIALIYISVIASIIIFCAKGNLLGIKNAMITSHHPILLQSHVS